MNGFIGQLYIVQVGKTICAPLLVQHTGRAQHGNDHIFTSVDHERKQSDNHQQQRRIQLHTAGKTKRLLFSDRVLRSIPDQAKGFSDAFHHTVAGIYTGRAAHTFHLDTVSDIYARWTHLHTLETINTITAGSISLFEFPPWFPAVVIVSHSNGIFIQ